MTPFFTPPPFAGDIPIYLAAVNPAMCRLAGKAVGRWAEMPALVTDEMLETFAVVADRDAIAGRLRERAGGSIDRIVPYRAFRPEDDLWNAMRGRGMR